MIMKIKVLREAAGLKQAEVANRMGVIRSAVANWELEISLPKSRELPRLARVLGCSIDELFEDDGSNSA